MGIANEKRYIEFRIVETNGTPVPGLSLGAFSIYFTRDASPCSDPFTLIDSGDGRYVLTYVPSLPGHDFIEIYHAATDLLFQDAEDIEGIGIPGALNQDYGGVGAFKLDVENPETYTVYVFESRDWEVGNHDPVYALFATSVDTNGNWVTPSFSLAGGSYHVVAINSFGDTLVLRAFLQV